MPRYRLDSQFHCSHLDSRGVPEKPRGKKRGKLSPFHFRFTTSGDVISGDATSGDTTSGRACAHDHFRHPHTAPPQIIDGWCFYTTNVPGTFKFLTFYQTFNKSQSVFYYIIYLSHSLFHGQVLLPFTILYVTTTLISLTIAGFASLACSGVLCMDWISGGSTVTYNLPFTISLASRSLNVHISSQDSS